MQALKAKVEKLEAQLQATIPTPAEAPVQAPPVAVEALTEIQERLGTLASAAAAPPQPPPPPSLPRPKTAHYQQIDMESLESWSADAFGRSRCPGWYHKVRKQINEDRARRAVRPAEARTKPVHPRRSLWASHVSNLNHPALALSLPIIAWLGATPSCVPDLPYPHTSTKQAGAPKGCYISHSKYADEAVRIANTGRLAF